MSIKIFMCTHKETDFVPSPCEAILGGAISKSVPGIKGDVGPGGDISAKNPNYCELTVLYYAYKNESYDYYGLCHYRRFFGTPSATKKPYLAISKPNSELLVSESELEALLQSYDVILPRTENIGLTVMEKYERSPHQFKSDLVLFCDIVRQFAPHIAPFMDEYLNSYEQYFCNMLIMKADIFKDYCSILFDLMEKFDEQKTLHGYFEADRTNGYLAERFLGAYALYLQSKGVKIYHLPRIDTNCSLKKRILNKILPPQSKIRQRLRRCKK